jgi:hypothetical protein
VPDRIAFYYDLADEQTGEVHHNSQADSIEYAWFAFPGRGVWGRLERTSLEVRKADRAEYRAFMESPKC